MSKWIQSFEKYEHQFGKLVLPKQSYTDDERNILGKSNIIEVTDEQLAGLKKDEVFNSICNRSVYQYKILDKLPAQYKSIKDSLKERDIEISNQKKENADLLSENKKLKAELEAMKEKGKSSDK